MFNERKHHHRHKLKSREKSIQKYWPERVIVSAIFYTKQGVIELSENENDYYIMQRKKELRKKENVSTSKDKHIIKDDTGYDPWDRMDDAKLTVFKRYNIRTDYEY